MSDIKERLEKAVAVLEHLERRRRDTRTPRWGDNTEIQIITAELRQLEEDILCDPGALESQLIRVLRKPQVEGEV